MTATREFIVRHAGVDYSAHIATIKSTSLTYEDHGILTMYSVLEWPGGGVSFGGYGLDEPTFEPPTADGKRGKFIGRKPTAYGLDFILQVMKVAGVDTYERIAGQRVLALFDYKANGSTWGAQVQGLAHIDDKDRIFLPKEHVKLWVPESLTDDE